MGILYFFFFTLSLSIQAETFSRTICGEDNRIAIKNAPPRIQRMSFPVGRMEFKSLSREEEEKRGYCTGTLVSSTNIFMTNAHCYDECSEIKVRFKYWEDPEQADVYECKQILKVGKNGNEDYFFFELEGEPAFVYGYYPLWDGVVKPESQLLLIGHPLGLEMQASWDKECKFFKEEGGYIHHRCDTMPGNSGSAILLPAKDTKGNFLLEGTKIIGLHALGYCDSNPNSKNKGPSIRYLSKIDKFIYDLAKKPHPTEILHPE